MSDVESTHKVRGTWRTAFEMLSTVTMIALAVVLVLQGRSRLAGNAVASRGAIPVPPEPISIANNPRMGGPAAKVAMIEYSDFQCPFCGAAARDALPIVINEYVKTGKITLVFKNLPLAMHALAPGAAAAALCAEEQGHFWPMHDRLFTLPSKLEDVDLIVHAEQVGLDLPRFDACRTGAAVSALVQQDRAEAAALNITGTPTFIIGMIDSGGKVRASEVVSGAKPAADFRTVLDRAIGSGSGH